MSTLKKITNNISKVIIGKDESIELAAIALIAKGHILLEDVPGTGKTTLAKSLAKSVDAKFQRIQFTADTLPGDVIGLEYFNVIVTTQKNKNTVNTEVKTLCFFLLIHVFEINFLLILQVFVRKQFVRNR